MKKLVIPMMLALAGCATTQTSTPVVQVFERKVQIPRAYCTASQSRKLSAL